MKVFGTLVLLVTLFAVSLAAGPKGGPHVHEGLGSNDKFCECQYIPDYWLEEACQSYEERNRLYINLKVSVS